MAPKHAQRHLRYATIDAHTASRTPAPLYNGEDRRPRYSSALVNPPEYGAPANRPAPRREGPCCSQVCKPTSTPSPSTTQYCRRCFHPINNRHKHRHHRRYYSSSDSSDDNPEPRRSESHLTADPLGDSNDVDSSAPLTVDDNTNDSDHMTFATSDIDVDGQIDYEEGYIDGYDNGYDDGYSDGYANAKDSSPEPSPEESEESEDVESELSEESEELEDVELEELEDVESEAEAYSDDYDY